MKLERLLAVIVLLLNNEKMTAKKLAEHFEVTERTVYRDIEAINLAGIPVVAHQGRNGGFGILESYKIDKNILTTNDLGIIITALTGIKSTLDDKRLNYLLEKITSLIPGEELENFRKEQEYIIIDFSPWDSSKVGKENLDIIKKAIKESKVLSFSYTSNKSENTIRKIEPIALISKSFIWYLYAYCLMRKDFRVFRLSRIKDAQILDEYFTRRKTPEDFSWDELWFSKIKKVDVVLRFVPKWKGRVEDYFNSKNIEIEENGYITVTFNYPDDEWLRGMILSFGSNVEVIEPVYLREELREIGENLLKIYK